MLGSGESKAWGCTRIHTRTRATHTRTHMLGSGERNARGYTALMQELSQMTRAHEAHRICCTCAVGGGRVLGGLLVKLNGGILFSYTRAFSTSTTNFKYAIEILIPSGL